MITLRKAFPWIIGLVLVVVIFQLFLTACSRKVATTVTTPVMVVIGSGFTEYKDGCGYEAFQHGSDFGVYHYALSDLFAELAGKAPVTGLRLVETLTVSVSG